jgi:hypothetical protein
VIRAAGPAAQDQVAVGVARGLDDRAAAESVDSEEDMLCRSGSHSVYGGLNAAVGRVLEPDGHR